MYDISLNAFAKDELCTPLAVLFVNNIRRKPSMEDINVSICGTCTISLPTLKSIHMHMKC